MEHFEELFSFGKEAVAELFLGTNDRFHRGLVLRIFVFDDDDRRSADDEGSSGLVDEDGVHFVDDGKIMAALDLFLFARGHAVIAKVIEAELGIGAVGDIAIVLLAPDVRRLIVQNATDGQSQELVNGAHPFTIASGEVIIHRHDVHATAGQRVEIYRQGRHQVLPSPVAISAIFPLCNATPPINWTSKGIMSHFNGCPRTMISRPHNRRQAFFTIAKASGMISSKASSQFRVIL